MKQFLNLYKVIEKPLKLIIITALFIFAGYKLQSVSVHLRTVDFDFSKCLLFLVVLAMTALNWFLEIKKWQVLKSVSFLNATHTVFNGLIANIFVPAGIGDISYRTFSDRNKKNNFYKSLQNSIAQFFPTVLTGMAALYFLPDFSGIFYHKGWILLGLSLPFFLFVSKSKENRQILTLSFLRYWVFIFQCYLLFYICSVHSVSYAHLWQYVAIFFLVRTLIPSFLLVELGIRASLSIIIFSAFEHDLGNIILAFTLLLLINNYLPAIIFKTFGISWLKKLSFSF